MLYLKDNPDSYIYVEKVDLANLPLPPYKIYLAIEIDAEYYHTKLVINDPQRRITYTLTVQMRGIGYEKGLIFSHPDSIDIARHPVLVYGFAPVDYLAAMGWHVSLERSDNIDNHLPVLQFDLYGYFLMADFYRMALGEYREDIDLLVLKTQKSQWIEMGRRLLAKRIVPGKRVENSVLMPWLLTIEGKVHRVSIAFYDCCAVHGVASYAEFCKNTGVKLEYKEVFTAKEKSVMNEQYVQRAEDFDNYAPGDLYSHEGLKGNKKKFQLIYKSLGLEDYFELPRLTIGATVARLFRSALLKELSLGVEEKHKVIEICRYGTSGYLKEIKGRTGVYNAKVDGGRCRNNRPIDVVIEALLADLDIASCYGHGLRIQEYPVGRPVIIDYPIKSDINGYLSLRNFLKEYQHDLVPGLWQARVSTPEGYELKYPQDFLVSWYPPRDISKMPTDTDYETIDWFDEEYVGITKIFTHQVHLAIIQHDFLQWLVYICTPRQRKELLDKLMVVTACYYPASERCQSSEEFFDAIENHQGINTCQVKAKRRRTKKISIEEECHAWYSVNIGNLLVDKLLRERGKYSKDNPEEKPLNKLYKLCNNTIYGDMVSPFFDIGNVVVGNNITARVRAMAWYMEKGLNGFQTITDGCAFEFNKVVCLRDRRITSESLFQTYANSKPHFNFKPIGNVEKIETSVELTAHNDLNLGLILHRDGQQIQLNHSDAKQWLNQVVKKHLQDIFPDVDVLHKPIKDLDGNEQIGQFNFEVKDIIDCGAFHGSANYKFWKQQREIKPKMRSYSPKDSLAYELYDEELKLISEEFHAADEFLNSLRNSPTKLPRSKTFIDTKILKTAEYVKNYNARWQFSQAFPGCTVEKARLLRECSLTQFTFRTYEQFLSWDKEAKRLRDLTGQTYEQFFTDENGLVNFVEMVKFLDLAIRSGKKSFAQTQRKSKSRNLARKYSEHPENQALLKAKHQLDIRYGRVEEMAIDAADSDEDEPALDDTYPDQTITQ